MPGEAQVRNPRRLQALVAGCRAAGVRIEGGAEVRGFDRLGETINAVRTDGGRALSRRLLLHRGVLDARPRGAGLHRSAPGKPVRGQMLLLRPAGRTLDRIVHRHPYYAVPRRDGRVLIGATVEEAGFSKQTTDEARAALLEAARLIDPRLARAEIEAHWSGLRPASADRLPQIGPLPGLTNAWVASGHHRSGLQVAPPTARLISAMIRGVPCDLPSEPFAPARFQPKRASAR